MASWTDGAEYAPTDRPAGFATPRAAPLPTAEPALSPAHGLPQQQPEEFRVTHAGPALEQLVPDDGPDRDPRQAFGTQRTAMTTSAWGSAHSSTSTATATHDPHAPFETSSSLHSGGFADAGAAAPAYPALGAAEATMATDQGPQAPPQRLAAVLQLVTWPILLALAVGCVIQPMSWVMLVVVVALASWHRVPRMGRQIRLVAAITAIAALLFGFVINLREDVLWQLGVNAQIGCVVTLATALILAGREPAPR